MAYHSRFDAAALCRALADPVRVQILNQCRLRQELSAREISETFGLHRSELQRHVTYLQRAHLISCRRVGTERQYRFVAELSPFHRKLVDFLISLEEIQSLVKSSDGSNEARGDASDTQSALQSFIDS